MPWIIRNEQMKAFGRAMEQRFAERMLRRLRRNYSSRIAQLSDEEVRGLIRQAIETSRKYGMVTETEVARYLNYVISYGAEFDRTEDWAAAILNTAGLTGRQKLDRIDEYDLFHGRGGLR
jgi:hypothetical protein